MPDRTDKLYALILDLRRCFNLLRAHADDLHKGLGVNASMRAIMESLAGNGEKTVPEIARSRGVSRQHVQVIANELAKTNLIETRENPRDKRTFLLSLTSRGRAVFGEIREREAVELRRLSEAFSTEELTAALKSIRKLNQILKGAEDE